MVLIGLTGGIASGKSTAAEVLKQLGAVVVDGDRLGHRAYEPGSPGFQKVVNEFGHEIVARDGTINRTILGGKVFGAPDQMKRLTDIVWPEIRRMAKAEIADARRRGAAVVVLEAAVLIEAGWQDLVDEVWVISVKSQTARERLMARNNLSADAAQARIASQLSNRERERHADVKIDNSGTIEQFERRLFLQWKKLERRAAQPAGSRR
ncbi:MAG: dephospho-CoA kinase [Dehalococcoidia bacterium]|nr:dephospho-CoA kinase [Dehalococcoidia bacterium]